VPIPTNQAGQTVIAPLGGETIDMGAGGSTEQHKLAWEWVQGMQQTDVMEHVTSLMYYLPTKPAVTEQVLKGGPEYTVAGHLDRDPGLDHRHLVGELGAADGAGHDLRSPAGQRRLTSSADRAGRFVPLSDLSRVSARISVEDLAFAEDLVPPGVPEAPHNPNPPRYSEVALAWFAACVNSGIAEAEFT
jgi:hypothetical protein